MEPRFLAERPDIHEKGLFDELLADFNKHLAQHRRRGPYVLMGRIHIERNSNRNPQVSYVPDLFRLPCGSMHSTPSDLQRYLDRGFIVLDYWIPKPEQINADRSVGNGAMVRSGWRADLKTEEGQKRMRELEAAILKAKGYDEKISALKERETTLQQKLKDAEAKLAVKK